jgi:hypothetical protein
MPLCSGLLWVTMSRCVAKAQQAETKQGFGSSLTEISKHLASWLSTETVGGVGKSAVHGNCCLSSVCLNYWPQVSNLWQVRDFWEWMAPGYSNQKTREFALANAAFTSYIGLRKFRDFKLELEATAAVGDVKVGLWAKAPIAPGRAICCRFACEILVNERCPEQLGIHDHRRVHVSRDLDESRAV